MVPFTGWPGRNSRAYGQINHPRDGYYHPPPTGDTTAGPAAVQCSCTGLPCEHKYRSLGCTY